MPPPSEAEDPIEQLFARGVTDGLPVAPPTRERVEANPWEPLHVEHGFAPDDSTVAALPGEPLQILVDGQSRTAADVLATVARSLEVVASHRTASLGDILIVLSPMHARTVAGDGWSKADARRCLWDRLEARREGPAPKFRAPENLKLVVAGGTAGPFTALIPGWPFADSPARLVLKKIRPPL